MPNLKQARSSIRMENLQEVLDASAHGRQALQKGQQQYETTPWLARACAALLPWERVDSVLDREAKAQGGPT